MLLPAIGRSKFMAKEARCLSQMRQISLGYMVYASDFKGWWPYRPGGCKYIARDFKTGCFNLKPTIAKYISPGEIFSCPFVDTSWEKQWQGGKMNQIHTYANWNSDGRKYYEPDGTEGTSKSVLPRRMAELKNRPILGDKIWWDGNNYHSMHQGGKIDDISYSSHNWIFDDGSGKNHKGEFVKVMKEVGDQDKQFWYVPPRGR
jgi:hypothetical protein